MSLHIINLEVELFSNQIANQKEIYHGTKNHKRFSKILDDSNIYGDVYRI